MGLVRNGRSLYQNPGVYTGVQSNQSGNWIKGGLRNRFVGGFDSRFSAYPNGHLHPGAFILPEKSGSLSSYTTAKTSITQSSATLIPAKPMSASQSLTIVATNAQLDQIVPLLASGSLSISVSNATLSASIPITASATLTISTANAGLGGIFPITASASCVLTPSATLTAKAFMTAEAGGPTPLSPEGLAQAVWSAILSDYTDAGTTGEALGNASSAGNPWDALLASNNDPGTFGERVQKLLTKNQFIGLK